MQKRIVIKGIACKISSRGCHRLRLSFAQKESHKLGQDVSKWAQPK